MHAFLTTVVAVMALSVSASPDAEANPSSEAVDEGVPYYDAHRLPRAIPDYWQECVTASGYNDDILQNVQAFCTGIGAPVPFTVPGHYAHFGRVQGKVHISIQAESCKAPVVVDGTTCMSNFWQVCASKGSNAGENDQQYGCTLYIIHFAGDPQGWKRSMEAKGRKFDEDQTFNGTGMVYDQKSGMMLDFEKDIMKGQHFNPWEH